MMIVSSRLINKICFMDNHSKATICSDFYHGNRRCIIVGREVKLLGYQYYCGYTIVNKYDDTAAFTMISTSVKKMIEECSIHVYGGITFFERLESLNEYMINKLQIEPKLGDYLVGFDTGHGQEVSVAFTKAELENFAEQINLFPNEYLLKSLLR